MDVEGDLATPVDKILRVVPSLRKCIIRLPFENGFIDDQGGPLGGTAVDGLLNLSFLDELRGGKDNFVPVELFVRQEVQDMFSLLITQHKKRVWRRILTGSPGIGKSVVFFLAALQRAFSLQQRVIYVRKVKGEAIFSVFVIERNPNGTGVNVLVGHDITRRRLTNQSLSVFVNKIIDASTLKDDDFYMMVDGPKHNDEFDFLLHTSYQALCTSGGYPAPKQAEFLHVRILVMSGWTEEKLKVAMRSLNILEIETKYELAGGRIRMVFWDEAQIKEWFGTVIQSIGQEAVNLAVTSNVASGCTESKDRLRTRFVDTQSGVMNSQMIVDSQFAFNKLKDRLTDKNILPAYNLAKVLGLKAASGWFYEEILHRRFRDLTKPPNPPIKEWIHEEGISGADGVKSFVQKCRQKTDIYWCPPIPNFANIDAALYKRESCILICYQYTVQEQHSFNNETFWEDFVNRLVVGGGSDSACTRGLCNPFQNVV